MEFHEISKLNATILDLELRACRGFNREKSDEDGFEKWKLPSSFTQKIKLLYNNHLVKEQILFSNIIGREKKKENERAMPDLD